MEGLNNFRALNLAHNHFSTHLVFSSICWITSRSQPLFCLWEYELKHQHTPAFTKWCSSRVGQSQSALLTCDTLRKCVSTDEDTVPGHREQCCLVKQSEKPFSKSSLSKDTSQTSKLCRVMQDEGSKQRKWCVVSEASCLMSSMARGTRAEWARGERGGEKWVWVVLHLWGRLWVLFKRWEVIGGFWEQRLHGWDLPPWEGSCAHCLEGEMGRL